MIKDTAPAREVLLLWLILGAVGFVAHFLLFPQFGLYEDDYLYTLPSFDWSVSEWSQRAWDALINPVQSRPLNHFVRRTLFFLTLRDGTLELAYLTSWALITTNAFLLHRLISRRFSLGAGAVAALLYLLHPADNARQILMHQTDIHLGTLLFVCSLGLFQARRYVLGWIVGGASLLNYESFYLPLLIAPFVVMPDPMRRWRHTALHCAVWVGLIVAVASARLFLGDDRAGGAAAAPLEVGAKALQAMGVGPYTSLRLLVLRPLDALLNLTPLLVATALAVGSLAYGLLSSRPYADQSGEDRGHWCWPLLGGLLGLAISYLFAFRPDSSPPVLSIGRLSAVHMPGIICTAVSMSALWYAVQQRSCARLHLIQVAIGSAACGLLAAFSLQIQLSEYVAHWTKQRDFWRDIIGQSPDLADGNVILVDVEGSDNVIPITPGFPRFGSVNYPPHALSRFLDFPTTWRHPPRVYGLWTDTPAELHPEGLRLRTPPYFSLDAQPTLLEGGFLFFRAEGDRLRRISTTVEIRGYKLTPKEAPSSTVPPVFQTSRLFRQLIEPRDGREWFTIRNSRNYPH